jgi:hypothetical protein
MTARDQSCLLRGHDLHLPIFEDRLHRRIIIDDERGHGLFFSCNQALPVHGVNRLLTR